MAAKGQLQKIYYHIPHDMCIRIFQGFTEIQNGRFTWAS